MKKLVLAAVLVVTAGCGVGSASDLPGSTPEQQNADGTFIPRSDAQPNQFAASKISLSVSQDADAGTALPAPNSAVPPPPPGSPDPCAAGAKAAPKGNQLRLIHSAGGARWYYVYIPDSYQPGQKTELVLNFHGFTSDPFQEALLSQMNLMADQRNFIVAYPAGIAQSWNAGQCCGLSAWVTQVDDVKFVSDTIDAISREYCIDQKRVFATGMSNGGFLSHELACELSDRIAAVAPVAGVDGMPSCSPKRTVPILQTHGTWDPLVPYYGGSPVGFIPVAMSNAGWESRNNCGGPEVTIYEKGEAKCVRKSGCVGTQDTILCTVDHGGHTWPGGTPVPPLGHTTMDLDTTTMMLDFFDQHPMP